MAQIFVSHSKLDVEIKKFFGDIFGRTKVKGHFVEYEKYRPPAWAAIQRQIGISAALFVLLGPKVAELAHTQVWIGSEMGAVPPGKEVWVFEHLGHLCDVPIPNVQHYMMYDYGETYENYIRAIMESYDDSSVLGSLLAGGAGGAVAGGVLAGAAVGGPLGAIIGAALVTTATSTARSRPMGIVVECPNNECQHTFRLHTRTDRLPCPVCRQLMEIPLVES